MNEEERKAIEETKNALSKTVLGIDVDFDINTLDVLLNLIEKQQKEIEKYKMLYIQSKAEGIAATLKDSTKAKEDLEMLNEGWRIELEKKDIALKECERNLIEERNERIKKDKIINEMAEYLAIIRDCPNEDKGANIDCENRCSIDDDIYAECWKLYFERESENESR